ncbi:MAG TPA: ribosome biogenesis GTP-binding protein YihA/YsxC [Usitatibacter sp.]|nr:ribosome biogenesis GTP-binding protein YihA/YsxC [Usitatibacter sp.]
MKPAKPVKKRIQGPRKKDGNLKKSAKPADFSPAGRRAATGKPVANGFPLAEAQFRISVHDPRELPPPGPPEIAFAGRSNAGKSSAINTLAGRRRLAFVSKTPGRTQLINFFSLGDRGFLVDLPGYGYAGVPGAVREHWKHLVGTYVATRPSLAAVVVVMDSRHPLTELDRTLLAWLKDAGREVHVLLTKADKLSKQAAAATLAGVRAQLAREHPGATAQLFSSLKRQGIPEATARLSRIVGTKNKAPAKGE